MGNEVFKEICGHVGFLIEPAKIAKEEEKAKAKE